MITLARARDLLRHRLVKNTAALFVVQVSTYVAPLIVLPYLSRILSTEHFGLIAFTTSFNFYFITLVEYGFNLTATRKIAIHNDEPENISRIFSSVLIAKALLTLLGFLIMLASVWFTPKLRPNLPLFCISYLAVVGDLLFPLWLFQGLQKLENLVWRDIASKFIALALVFAFVRQDADYMWAAAFQSGSTIIAGVVGLATVPFLTPVRWIPPPMHEVWAALKEGWPVFVSMAAMTLSTSTNIFILGLRSGTADVAYYIAAQRLIVALRSLVSPLSTAIYPHISHLAAKSRENAVAFLQKCGLIIASPFLVSSVILFAFAPLVIHLIYGQKYEPTVLLLRILAFSPFFLALQYTYSTFFMLAFGYDKEWSKVIFQTAVLNFIVLVPLLFLIWPPVAVCTTTLILDIFVTAVTYAFYRKHAPMAAVSVPA